MRIATAALVVAIGTACGTVGLALEQHRELTRLAANIDSVDRAANLGHSNNFDKILNNVDAIRQTNEDIKTLRTELSDRITAVAGILMRR